MFNDNDPLVFGLRKKYSLSTQFKICAWEAMDNHIKITGIATDKKYTTGKRKGKWNYAGKKTVLSVTQKEIEQFKQDYEVETGMCSKCSGSGQNWQSWNHIIGSTYRQCNKCGGTGQSDNKDAEKQS